MALAGCDPQPCDHFLYEVAYGQKHNQRPQEMETVLAARLHIGGYSACIVVRLHYDQARAKDHEEGEDVLLPGSANCDAFGGQRGGIQFGFGYAHRCILPALSAEDAVLVACGAFAPVQTRASGILGSPVGTQWQVRETGFRTKCNMLFTVPPRAARCVGARSDA